MSDAVYGRESGDWSDGPPETEIEPQLDDEGVCAVCSKKITLKIEPSVMDGGMTKDLVWRHAGLYGFIEDHQHRAELGRVARADG